MANRRVLVRRRKSVRNIRKITRTMQLIATARFQAAMNRAAATRPYTEKLAELVRTLAEAATDVKHPLMETHPEVQRSALVVITSNRGLCGAYNSNVLRKAIGHIEEQKAIGREVDVYMVGKKGANYFKFLRRPVSERLTNISDTPRFDQIEPVANRLMDSFARAEISGVHVAYMKFISAGQQRPDLMTLMPLAAEPSAEPQKASRPGVQFEFSPEPAELLAELLPATVRVRLFQCFTEAVLCEHIARMVAMKAATDAAADMITSLTRVYNRARQTHITMELLDIVGGANALA